MIPARIELKKKSKALVLGYGDGSEYELSFEFLRVHSPSAEVRGHGNAILQTGKRHVTIASVEQSGNYALKLTFDDGHDSGLYTWAYLRELCLKHDDFWRGYLEKLDAAAASRD